MPGPLIAPLAPPGDARLGVKRAFWFLRRRREIRTGNRGRRNVCSRNG